MAWSSLWPSFGGGGGGGGVEEEEDVIALLDTMEEDDIVPLDAIALLAMASKLSGNGGFNLRDVVMSLVLILKM